jgi:hypothetical protein
MNRNLRTWRQDVKTLSMFLGVAALLLVQAPFADEVVRGVKDTFAITDETGVSRLLFRLDGGIDVPNFAIERATLDLRLVGEREDRKFVLQIHPVTTQGNRESVDWTTGWTRAGGDFEDDLYAKSRVDFAGGDTRGVFALTVPLKEVLEVGMPADGFILTLSPIEGRGIPEDVVGRFANLDRATVKISYKILPPGLPDRLSRE